jgi:hypothetical protein
MKSYLLLLAMLLVSGCTSSTPHGKCIGLNGDKDPSKIYEYSARNIIVGLVFIETIFVPVIVTLNELQCPIDNKGK